MANNLQFKGKFGLVIPKKKEKKKRPVVINFEEDDADTLRKNIQASTGAYKRLKKEAEAAQAEALAMDANAFAYDEVYDNIQTERNNARSETLLPTGVRRESKYIHKLKQKAEIRELDLLRAEDKKFQKQQEKEGDLYRDKLSFVTGGYKKHLKEMSKWEEVREEQDRQDLEREKQRQDMSSFAVNAIALASGGGASQQKNRDFLASVARAAKEAKEATEQEEKEQQDDSDSDSDNNNNNNNNNSNSDNDNNDNNSEDNDNDSSNDKDNNNNKDNNDNNNSDNNNNNQEESNKPPAPPAKTAEELAAEREAKIAAAKARLLQRKKK